MFCVQCGTAVKQGSSACSSCGTPTGAQATPAPPATPLTATPPAMGVASSGQYAPPVYQKPPSNGAATAGFVLSLVSLFLSVLIVPLVLAIVFSSMGLSKSRELEATIGQPVGRGLAIAGLVISIVVAFFTVLWFLLFI